MLKTEAHSDHSTVLAFSRRSPLVMRLHPKELLGWAGEETSGKVGARVGCLHWMQWLWEARPQLRLQADLGSWHWLKGDI